MIRKEFPIFGIGFWAIKAIVIWLRTFIENHSQIFSCFVRYQDHRLQNDPGRGKSKCKVLTSRQSR